MSRSQSPAWRRFVSSLAYVTLGALLLGIGYLATHPGSSGSDSPKEQQSTPVVELARFSSMIETRSAGNRMRIAFRMRTNQPTARECYVYVVTRNDDETPPLWAVWPPKAGGLPGAESRHLRVENPTKGHRVLLSEAWVQVNATIDQPPGQTPFNRAVVYVVEPDGKTILARPFAL